MLPRPGVRILSKLSSSTRTAVPVSGNGMIERLAPNHFNSSWQYTSLSSVSTNPVSHLCQNLGSHSCGGARSSRSYPFARMAAGCCRWSRGLVDSHVDNAFHSHTCSLLPVLAKYRATTHGSCICVMMSYVAAEIRKVVAHERVCH